jgi:hypothetical protein
MKVGDKHPMKAICIKNYDEVNSRTTIGKVYEIFEDYVINDSDDKYFVADNGDELWYQSNYFISVEQWRENQLNKIGI